MHAGPSCSLDCVYYIMDSNVSQQFKEEFAVILNQKDFTPNEQLQSLLDCLRLHHLLYTMEKAVAKLFLVHKENRGGLLVSPHNVHRNALRIYNCGADMKQLTNAVCLELPPSGKLREEHLAKNKALVERAAGLLAPINGSERYITLGCGHTMSFCKQAAVHGDTSETQLQCADSNKVDVQKLCRQAQFKAMIQEGWSWTVVPYIIDQLFPSFAKIAIQALNTQNHVGTEVGELETCMTLASTYDDPGMQDLPNWKELAVESVARLNVPCSKYSITLLDVVINFGGGDGAPHIAFMDSVAKAFGCNVNLGRSFWEALTTSVYTDRTRLFPLLRVSLALANMTDD